MSLELLRAESLNADHAFATRAGGVSEGAFRSLNLGLTTGDDPDRVERNRRLFLEALDSDPASCCGLVQIHSDRVVVARRSWFEIEADASVSDDPGLLLVVSAADCLPVLMHDTASGAVGAAHCGWRGSAAGLAARTLETMSRHFGTRGSDLRVAIGPGICQGCYQVGSEVASAFSSAGLGAALRPDDEGRFRLDLVASVALTLEAAGVDRDRIEMVGGCTSCSPGDFFSHRRDQGVTGRHWAAIRATRHAPSGAARS